MTSCMCISLPPGLLHILNCISRWFTVYMVCLCIDSNTL